eukprot:2824470-Rhodomonas_salina.1
MGAQEPIPEVLQFREKVKKVRCGTGIGAANLRCCYAMLLCAVPYWRSVCAMRCPGPPCRPTRARGMRCPSASSYALALLRPVLVLRPVLMLRPVLLLPTRSALPSPVLTSPAEVSQDSIRKLLSARLKRIAPVSYTHLRAHETEADL